MNHPDRPDAGTPARRTPYELVFHSDDFEARVFPRVCEEAAARGVDPLHPDRFSFLSVVGDAVRDVLPPHAPPESLDQYRVLLYHAFNFWRFGKRVYVLDAAVARYLVEAAPAMTGWEFALPHPSVYVQLPPNLFWSRISSDSPPEPVDGFFAAAVEEMDPLDRPFTRLEVLAVLGIRRDRAGFSVVPFDTEVGPGIVAAWVDAPGREEGADFENVLPGGDLGRLYSILTTGEVLKLLARALWYVESFPDEVVLESLPGRAPEGTPGAPPRPRLPYFRVSLRDAAGEP